MSDVTYTDAWKKQQKPIGLSASNETVRRLEQQGHMEKGNLHLEALYLSILVEVSGAVAEDQRVLHGRVGEMTEQLVGLQVLVWAALIVGITLGLTFSYLF